jgi:hypothetical protein
LSEKCVGKIPTQGVPKIHARITRVRAEESRKTLSKQGTAGWRGDQVRILLTQSPPVNAIIGRFHIAASDAGLNRHSVHYRMQETAK